MKITLKADPILGRVVFSAAPDEYDGLPPVQDIWIDGRLHGAHSDRVCIAEALLFRSWLAGPITFSVPCSPLVATGLQRFFHPRSISVASVSLARRDVPVGGRVAVLRSTTSPGVGTADVAVALAPDARFRTVFDVEHVTFGSNVRSLCKAGETEGMATLALAVLFAQDLSIREIVAERAELAQISDESVNALRDLLAAVNLALNVVTAAMEGRNTH